MSKNNSKYPPFQLDKPRFDQGTFFGRFRHMLDIIDPRTLLTTDKELRRCITLLEDFEKGAIDPKVTDRELWEAQKVKQAIIHPDTGEKILPPFRMSGFVPFGTPIVIGLLLPNPTLWQSVFWQWLNQSHNAGVNYSNRNATKPVSLPTFIQGYVGACVAAVSIAVGATVLLRRAKTFDPAIRMAIERFVSFPAVASASVTNALLVRRHELRQGIDVTDAKGNVVGTSRLAAREALAEIGISRFALSGTVFFFSPAILIRLEKTKWLANHPYFYTPINVAICTLSFGLALPLSLSIFPQISSISRVMLEPEIQEATCEPVLFYNKGL